MVHINDKKKSHYNEEWFYEILESNKSKSLKIIDKDDNIVPFTGNYSFDRMLFTQLNLLFINYNGVYINQGGPDSRFISYKSTDAGYQVGIEKFTFPVFKTSPNPKYKGWLDFKNTKHIKIKTDESCNMTLMINNFNGEKPTLSYSTWHPGYNKSSSNKTLMRKITQLCVIVNNIVMRDSVEIGSNLNLELIGHTE